MEAVKIDKIENYKPIPAYLRITQHKALKSVKNDIKEDYGISISITEIIRDAIDNFIETQGNDLGTYLKNKGW